jgi:hypothetical protein
MDNPIVDQAPRSFAEQRFIDNLQASSSSLPNTPTEPATDVSAPAATPVTPPAEPIAPVVEPTPAAAPEPAAPVQLEPAAPEPVVDVDDDFSADFIDAAPIQAEGTAPAAPDPNSPLAADAPQWQQDAFKRLQNDESISAEDRKTIAELPPTAWDKARRWQRDTQTFGKFRDKNVAISEVYDVLTKQSKDRTTELEIEALNRLVTDPSGEKMGEFSAKYPKVYTELLSGLITQHPDFVQEALKAKGFVVSKIEQVDVDAALADIKNDPLWTNIEDTPLGDQIEAKLKVLAEQAARAKAPEFAPEPSADVPSDDTAYQAAHAAIVQVRDSHWLKAVGDGLVSQGIKPATQEETRINPAAAHLKNMVYTAALRGLPGILPDWDEHSAQWGQKQEGFLPTFQELTSYMQEGDYDKFQENAPAMNPYYYEFGERRGNIPLIKRLYKFVDSMFGAAQPPPPPPEPQTITSPNGSPAPAPAESRFKTLSEKRFFEKRSAG